MDKQKMTVEEKIKRLSEKEKAYVLGYIDSALLETAEKKDKPKKEQKKNGKS